MRKLKGIGIPDLLIQYEASNIITKYKFGVLYVKPGQKDENEFYSNGKQNNTSVG